jgi:CheY-like chemotaxis protein/anti-sigma regulatory factor (Ser/Thr protein kinase)
MNNKSSSIIIQSDTSNLVSVFEWAEENLFINIKDKNIVDNLKLCIQEAVVNSIIHGNKNDKEKLVTISYKITDCKLFLKVKDEGDGIPEVLRKKEFSNQTLENIFEESGRGLMLIKHFCLNVKFAKNYLQMIVKLCDTTFDKLKNISDGICILYVEDNDISRERMEKTLKMFFPELDTAFNGKNALELYMSKKYDLVISDIVMPELNGIELVKVIKNVSKSQRVIFLSAYTEIKYLIEAIELGVDGFVFKPIEHEKLYMILLKVIKQIKQTRENKSYKQELEKLVQDRTKDLESTNKELLLMIEEVKKSNQLKEEMKIAQQVQENFLPKTLLNSTKIKTASFFKSATYVGGDYYDIFYCNNGNINIIIADVSGHGIAPAITMSTFRGICRATLGTSRDMQEDVQNINNILCEDSKNNDFFITAVYKIL